LPIPKRLKEARLLAGITQESLGIQAGIDEFSSSARMNQYEKGVHVPGYELLERCAAVLNVPVEYFYTRSDDVARLLIVFHRMNSREKKRLLSSLID
jgi:transcriptional regulator with XRE-family HTH domain